MTPTMAYLTSFDRFVIYSELKPMMSWFLTDMYCYVW